MTTSPFASSASQPTGSEPAGDSTRQANPIAWTELDDRTDLTAPATDGSAHPLLDVRVQLTVRLGQAELSIGDLAQARAGRVLPLDARIDQPVDLLLNGRVVARGELVAVDDVFAVRLTEPPAPLRF